MTLYLLFEELDKGAMTLQTQIPISEHAAAQEPSKLGLDPGQTISVEDAIKAVVTRSANDVAVAIGEAIGRDEDNFADMMTRKARALGMSSTVYRNASGLPNDQQVTTARDLTILARALEDRFPRYFHYFSTARVRLCGRGHRQSQPPARPRRRRRWNQDRLHKGVRIQSPDLRPSRRPVADRGRHGRPHRGGARPDHGESDRRPYRRSLDRAHRDDDRRRFADEKLAERAAPRETPAHPTAVPGRACSASPPRPARRTAAKATTRQETTTIPAAAARSLQASGRPASARSAAGTRPRSPASVTAPTAAPAVGGKRQAPAGGGEAPRRSPTLAPSAAEDATNVAARALRLKSTTSGVAAAQGGWMIQIGATDDLAKANALLIRARAQNRSTLASAKPVTEKVRKGDDTIYRARFAVLDSASAEVRLPLPQTQWIFLFPRPRLTHLDRSTLAEPF